jgi:hypothetical protein
MTLAEPPLTRASIRRHGLVGRLTRCMGVSVITTVISLVTIVIATAGFGIGAELANIVATTIATVVAWTTAFAASTAVFNATYKAQSDVDARLTNGADVTVTEPPAATVGPEEGDRLAAVGGVASVEPLQHRYAYVGADLQDLNGVRTSTIVAATKLQDAYFQGGTACDLVRRLDAQSDGILVSSETVRDFQLRPGDTLRLRLQDGRTKQLTEVPFPLRRRRARVPHRAPRQLPRGQRAVRGPDDGE